MISIARSVLLGCMVFTGCHSVKRAAVTTFRVIDTPARYVRERIDAPETTTTTTTTSEYATSDVLYPGRPVVIPTATPPPNQRIVPRNRVTSPTPTPGRMARTEPDSPPQPTPSPRASPRSTAAPSTREFPTARAVPGKPGYVYSIDPNGGIVDVTGYKSGDKAKDPYTQQIFIVP